MLEMLRNREGKEFSNQDEGYLLSDVASWLRCSEIDIKRFMAYETLKAGQFSGRIDYNSYSSGLAKLGNVQPGVLRNGNWFDASSFPNGQFAFLKALKRGSSEQQLSKEQLGAMAEVTGKTHFTVELKGTKKLSDELLRPVSGGFVGGISGIKCSKKHFKSTQVKACYLADSIIDAVGKLCGESLETLYSNAEAFNGFKLATREIILNAEKSFSLTHKVDNVLKPITVSYSLKNSQLFKASEIDQMIQKVL